LLLIAFLPPNKVIPYFEELVITSPFFEKTYNEDEGVAVDPDTLALRAFAFVGYFESTWVRK
jgi:hypothetical protein